MRRRLTLSIAGIAAVWTTLWQAPVEGQLRSELLGNPVAWEVYYERPEPVVTGLVVGDDGAPREGVFVTVQGTEIYATTDAEGRFEVRVPGAGEWSVEFFGMGVQRLAQQLTIPQRASVRMLVLLSGNVGGVCGLRACDASTECRDLRIEVVDSRTGEWIQAEVTVKLEHESGVWTNTMTPDINWRIVGLERPIETQGFHNIEVTVPGYAPWRAEAVWFEVTNECHPTLIGAEHVAILTRIEP